MKNHDSKHSGRPWHLIPQEEREGLLADSASNVDYAMAIGKSVRAEAIEAAFRLLREAAPYPDEALVFATGECALDPVVQLVDIGWTDDYGKHHPESLMCEDDEGTEAPYHPSELRPLTIAAHEVWVMLGGD